MKNALGYLFRTENSTGPTVARLMLGVVMFPHGAQKMLGWFGGYGFSGTMHSLTTGMHIPAALAFLAILAEFAGSLGLITGLLSRIAAFGIGVNMVVAILAVHKANGFFMNWFGNQKGEGFEYHLLAIGLALVVLIQGAGRFSLDNLIARGFLTAKRAQT
jgi:putative oxidoreductase